MKRLWFFLFLSFGIVAFGISLSRGLPSFEEVKATYPLAHGATTYYDRHGKVLTVQKGKRKDRRQDWVSLDAVPNHFISTLLMVEDKRFYQHSGVDFLAIAAQPFHALHTGKIRGVSTLTMQLTGLLSARQSRVRNIREKLQQMVSALLLEVFWEKAEILEAYLNLVSYRGDLVGLDAASLGLFQKKTHGLVREESLILSALLSSPNAKPKRVAERACRFSETFLCPRLEQLAQTHLGSRARLPSDQRSLYHFIQHIDIDQAEVQTTIDRKLQRLTEETIRDQLSALKSQHVEDAAAIIMNYHTGEVLSYVGSSGELSSAREVDGVRAPRQAGSTLKPFLFAKAFEDRLLTPDSWLDDSPYQVQTPHGVYSPENYDESFRGLTRADVALASSLNIPAVRVLDLLGVQTFYDLLQRLGFTLRPLQTYGHSLSLGAADVSLFDLVRAYSALAREGSTIEPRLVVDDDSRVGEKIFSPRVAKLISKILAEKENRAPTFGFDNVLSTPYPASVKTGTSKDMRDNWCLGYDDTYVVGVWVGNFDGSPMWNVSGVTGAAPIWRTLMDTFHRDGEERSDRKLLGKASGTPAAPARYTQSTQTASSKIIYPLDGTLIAYDPDIPEESQALFFEHSASSDPHLTWTLDGRKLADNLASMKELDAGKHTLELKDQSEKVLDSVVFEVRGKH